jgi:hypothetical protein
MVSILGTHRRAEQFAAAVDSRTPVDDLSPDLRVLAELVGDLRAQRAPAPRADFSAHLRERLMAEAEVSLSPVSPLALPPRRTDRARQRRLTAAAAVFTLVGGSAGLAAAAEQSLPGDALYPIKRGIEDAQLGLQSEPADKGRAYLAQAEERLDEASSLIETGAPSDQVAGNVDLFVVQAVAGSSLLLDSYRDGGSTEDVESLRDFSARTLDQLQDVAKDAPADLQDELARAAVVVRGIDEQASAACASCEDRPSLQLPALMAQAAQISQAMEALRSQEVSNDHPALELKVPTSPLDSNGARSTDGSESDDGEATSTDGTGIDIGADLPQSPRQALDGLDDATGGLVGSVGDSTEKTVKQLTEELEEQVDDTLDGDVLGSE